MKKVRYSRRHEWFNDNNRPEMAPFTVTEGQLIVEAEQYDAWKATDGLQLLQPYFTDIVRSDEIIDRLQPYTQPPDWYYKVYNTIMKRGCPTRWWDTLIYKGGIVTLDAERCKQLTQGQGIKELATDIQKIMDSGASTAPDGWFVKIGPCSTKHQYPPAPMFSGLEAVEHLLNADPVKIHMEKGTAACVAVRPWDNRVGSHNEVRVFVRQGRVTGVSQQACYGIQVLVNILDPKEVIESAQRCYDEFNAQLKPEHQFNYQCTFDGYLTTDDDATLLTRLIEINSEMFGWGPAGASLFHWKTDPPPQPNEEPVFYVMTTY
jgi:hypothetical protein